MLTLTVHRQREFTRPIAEVHAYLADFSTSEQWDPGVFRAEKRTPGAPAAGTAFELQLNVLGRAVPAHYTLVETVAPTRLRLEGRGDGFEATDTLLLEPLGPERTRLDYAVELRWPALPAGARRLLRPWAERLGDRALDGLARALCEDGPESLTAGARLAQRLILPGMAAFTRRGVRGQHSRGLSRRLDGRTVAITGATAGLGLAAAQELARLGARLLLIGRGRDRLAAAADAVQAFAGGPAPVMLEAELSSIADTRRLADKLLATEPALDVLINNAGALFAEHARTAEGHERALAVNLLTPALLALALAPRLAARGGRLINVVSGGLYLQPLRLDDLDSTRDRYDGAQAYARAKRGLLALTRRWAAEHPGLAWHAMHPGWAATPGVASSLPAFERRLRPWLRSPREGADTMVWLASHPEAGPAGSAPTGFWFDRALRPDALLPGTAVSAADAARLDDAVRQRIGDVP